MRLSHRFRSIRRCEETIVRLTIINYSNCMLRTFIKEAFASFHAGSEDWREESVTGGSCNAKLTRAIEHVIDETDSRIRAIPHYEQKLKGPVEKVFRFVDDVVEDIPPPINCDPSNFTRNATVRALFAGPDHLKKVFSESENVRTFFDSNQSVEDCWALLCMEKEERRKPGMALVNNQVMRDVYQTTINFSDHQLMSPGDSEEDARCALKSCIFNSLLVHAKQEARSSLAEQARQEARLAKLKRKLASHDRSDITATLELENEKNALEKSLVAQPRRLMTPTDNLEYVISILENPQQYVSESRHRMTLDNMNVLLEEGDPGNQLELSEITVASHVARVALLVRFPRADLLAAPDFSRMADVFLAN